MTVKITQKQADFLKTFEESDEAIYYISRWGWAYALEDGNEKVYLHTEEKPFKQSEKMKMIEDIINGYEVIEPKFKFYHYSDDSNPKPLYYAGKIMRLMSNKQLAKEIEKGSEEYVALEKLGFIKEEV